MPNHSATHETALPIRGVTAAVPNESKARPRESTLVNVCLAVGIMLLVATVALLLLHGWSYYELPLQERFRSELHPELKPGGRLGMRLGVVGGLLLLGLLPYSLRKRAPFMSDWGKLSSWLRVHIFCGIAGPILITFHTSFKVHGLVAIAYWCMILVALSGLVGRYLYAQIPRAIGGREFRYKTLVNEQVAVHERLAALLDPFSLRHVLNVMDFKSPPPRWSLMAFLLMLRDDVGSYFRRRRLRRILSRVPGLGLREREAIVDVARERELLQRRIVLLRASRDLFKYWHIIHVPLAQTMYITVFLHIGVAIMTGYF